MALKILTSHKKHLIGGSDNRFDPKYYVIQDFFKKLENNSSCSVKTLFELGAEISSGSYVNKYIDSYSGIKYLRVGNIKPFSVDEQERGLVYVDKNLPEKIKVKKNDIILGRTQATAEKLGVASIADDFIADSVISQHVTRIRIDNRLVTPEYLAAYLNSNFYKAQTALCSHGDTRVEMTHGQMKQIRVFIPEDKIVKEISKKVKVIINNNRESIRLLEKSSEIIKESLNLKQENNEKYFNVDVSSLKEFGIWNANSHLPKFTILEEKIINNFKSISLGEICEISKGVEVGSSNYITDLFKKDTYFAFIRTSDIINNEIDLFPDYFVSDNHEQAKNHTLNGDEILFSKDGIIGETALISKHDRIICASGFAILKTNLIAKQLGISKEYILSILNFKQTGYYPAKRRTIIASTIPHLRIDRIREIRIPIFDKNTMSEISKLINSAYNLKDQRKKLIIDVRNQIDNLYK